MRTMLLGVLICWGCAGSVEGTTNHHPSHARAVAASTEEASPEPLVDEQEPVELEAATPVGAASPAQPGGSQAPAQVQDAGAEPEPWSAPPAPSSADAGHPPGWGCSHSHLVLEPIPCPPNHPDAGGCVRNYSVCDD